TCTLYNPCRTLYVSHTEAIHALLSRLSSDKLSRLSHPTASPLHPGFLPRQNGNTMVPRHFSAFSRRVLQKRAPTSSLRREIRMFRGSITALVTPFQKDGSLDEKAFRDLVDWQIQEGTKGLVPVGTTGESPTLSHEEHADVVKMCVEIAAGRVPVIAGAGSNSTREAIYLAQHAQEVGADAVLVVTPYYNKPNQRGLYEHYAAIARAVTLPIIIYNIPPRSVIDMTPETMGRLHADFK